MKAANEFVNGAKTLLTTPYGLGSAMAMLLVILAVIRYWKPLDQAAAMLPAPPQQGA